MSRISRYKDSIEKFFKSKSYVADIDPVYKNHLLELSSQTDYFVSIILLTIMNNISKKHNLSLHGYFMASGIEGLYILNRIYENKKHYEQKLGTNELFKLTMLVNNNLYKSLSQNIDTISTHLQKEKVLKINSNAIKYITNKLETIVTCSSEPTHTWISNDIKKYKFSENNLSNKLLSLKVFTKDELMQYIDKKMGTICKLTLVTGWLLGNGDENKINNLEKLGTYMAQFIKIAYDFNNIEEDLKFSSGFTYNSVITLGFQEAFEIFQNSREKFVEGCMLIDIHTNTIKEIIDVLEDRMDIFIDNTTTTQSESN